MSAEKLPGFRSRSEKQKLPQSNKSFSTLMETSPSQVPSASSGINCLIFTKDFEDEKIPIKAENEHSLLFASSTCSWIHRATVSLMQLQDYDHDDHLWREQAAIVGGRIGIWRGLSSNSSNSPKKFFGVRVLTLTCLLGGFRQTTLASLGSTCSAERWDHYKYLGIISICTFRVTYKI